MRRALAEAVRGQGRVEPNPMVGATVVTPEGNLIAVGHHTHFGGPHAEVVALDRAGETARGATLYVTLEPCCHHGKTPPCTDRIMASGVARVVAAVGDPFPKVAGGGFARLRAAGIDVIEGIEAEAAVRLMGPYLKRQFTGRPYAIAKWAMTLDGKTATASGSSFWITNDRSRTLVHELRGRMDAILVGIGTALADDPLLTARPPGPRTAARVVLDSRARLPLDSRLARTAREVPTWVAVAADSPIERRVALESAGCEVLVFETPGSVPILSLQDELGRRGVTNLLIEGGGRVLGAFLDAGEVDEAEAYLAPKLLGGEPRHVPALGQGVGDLALASRIPDPEITILDGDVRIRGIIPQPWRSRALDGGPDGHPDHPKPFQESSS